MSDLFGALSDGGGVLKIGAAQKAYFRTLPNFWQWKRWYERNEPHRPKPHLSVITRRGVLIAALASSGIVYYRSVWGRIWITFVIYYVKAESVCLRLFYWSFLLSLSARLPSAVGLKLIWVQLKNNRLFNDRWNRHFPEICSLQLPCKKRKKREERHGLSTLSE